MNTFKDETALANLIETTNRVSYTVAAEHVNQKTPDGSDLFYIRGILVSNVWNLNDDVFDTEEMWLGRSSVVDKPINIEHDSSLPIGHVTSQWAIDSDGEMLSNELDPENLPALYHLAVGGVIYAKCRDPKHQEMLNEVMAGIRDGKRFLSMEVAFQGFDYALRRGPKDPVHIVKRAEATAFLSEKLRAYGGEGQHDGWSVGRVLRGLNFVGMGIVEKPGNPDSVIWTAGEKISNFSFASADSLEKIGVYRNRVEIVSASDNFTNERENQEMEDQKQELAEARRQLAEARQQLDALRDEISKADVAKLEAELAEARQANSDLQTKIEEVEQAKACMCSQYEEIVKEKETVDTELDTLKAKLAELDAAKKAEARLRVFLDKGYSEDESRDKVAKLGVLSDADFEQIASLIPAKKTEANFTLPEETETEASENSDIELESQASETVVPGTVETDQETETLSLATQALANMFEGIWAKKEK